MSTHTQRIEEIPINLLSEFMFDENARILYWRNVKKNTEDLHRLTNFAVYIKRRFKLVGSNGYLDMITLILHGLKDLEITISLSELSSLMKYIEKNYPEYRLYPELWNRKDLFKQYVSEVYEKTVNNCPEETVYQNAGWNLNSNSQYHYYSANDSEYCLSQFRLSNNLCFLSRDLISWAMGLLNMGTDEVMIPLLLHAHLGYTLHLFENAGYQEQYILALIGSSGSKKTSVARVMFSLFGDALINFTSTDRAIELSLMQRQDSTLILDDLTSGNNKDLAGKFERILRQLGDSTGRRKTVNSGTEQENVKTRCAVVLTAETDIDSLSKSSKLRTLALPVNVNSFNSKVLMMYQSDAENARMLGTYSKLEQYMTFYIDHLTRNYHDILNFVHQDRFTIQANDLKFARQVTIFKMLKAQAIILLDFWIRYNMIRPEEVTSISNRFLNAISRIIMMNEQRCIEFEPYILFLKAISELLASEGLVASDKNDFMLENRYGYWLNGNIILKAEQIYNYVCNYYFRQGKLFAESLHGILDKLYSLDLLEVYEQKDHKPKLLKQVKIREVSQNVICLKWSMVERLLTQIEW